MSQTFKTIALIGKQHHEGAQETLAQLYKWLKNKGYNVFIETKNGKSLACLPSELMDLVDLGKNADLAIVIGGDGNMLGAARVLAKHDIKVIGVNRGNLGFLTDIAPAEFETTLTEVLAGEYDSENRFLLEAKVYRHGELKATNSAVNEAVLHPGKIAHMIEFEVYIDGRFMYSQRADGMIVSTPTGSTAHSLSAGGAILTPNLNALILVPMFPHTLSCRPIVVDGDSEVTLVVSLDMPAHPLEVSCDGHISLPVLPGDKVVIRKAKDCLHLIHPKGHSYFHVLRHKLGWGSRLF